VNTLLGWPDGGVTVSPEEADAECVDKERVEL
jgi:hypothetical protein